MSPPEQKNNAYPYALYYLGGGLMNIFASGVFFVLYVLLRDVFPYAGAGFIPVAGLGAILGLSNLLPLRFSGLDTDGRNLVSLRKSERTRRANWILLSMNARLSSGERCSDFPAQWFEFPDDYDYSDTIQANVACIALSRHIYDHDFIAAKALAETILLKGANIIGLMKKEIHCELLFIETIGKPGEERQREIERLYTPELSRYIKMSRAQPSKHRLMYAYEKLFTFDGARAMEALESFNSACEKYPFSGIRDCERELIGIVDELAAIAGQ